MTRPDRARLPDRRLSLEAALYLEKLRDILRLLAWIIEAGPGWSTEDCESARQQLVILLEGVGVKDPDDATMTKLLELGGKTDVSTQELSDFISKLARSGGDSASPSPKPPTFLRVLGKLALKTTTGATTAAD